MKRFNSHLASAALALSGLCLPLGANAAFTTYFGSDFSQLTAPGGAPLKQQGLFTGMLQPDKTVSDGLTNAKPVPGATVPTYGLLGGMTLTGVLGDNRISNVGCDEANCNGRFNTTGDADGPWWETKENFTVSFEQALSAFGFYATDIGDFGARVSLMVRGSEGELLETILFSELFKIEQQNNKRITGQDDDEFTPNGSLLFFGFTDTERLIKSVDFVITQATGGDPAPANDYIGFDDFLTGPLKSIDPPTDVPEPATLSLVAGSLALLAMTRRRRWR